MIAASQTDELIDMARGRTMLDEHRSRRRRPQPPAVDGADLHALARDLRRAQR